MQDEKDSRDARQKQLLDWADAVFGGLDGVKPRGTGERGERFAEEAFELLQAIGIPKERLQALLDRVYSRPSGEIGKEAGATAVTLSMLCEAANISLHDEETREAQRIMAISAESFRKRHMEKVARLGHSSAAS